MKKIKKLDINDVLPFIVFIIIAIIFGVATNGTIFSATNLKDIFNQSVATLLVGLGMVCVVAMGGTDISLGALIAVATSVTCIVAQWTGGWIMFPLAIVMGVCSGLLVGIMNAKFKVPSFMLTLSVLIAYRALNNLLLKTSEYVVPESMMFVDGMLFKLIAVLVLTVIVGYILMVTPYGFYLKSIGENETAVINMGINTTKIKVIAFMISGIMAGIAAIFTVVRVGGTQTTMGLGLDMRVMIAMYLCGIPVQGGFRTKIHKLLLGVPTVMLLEKGLVLWGLSGGVIQLIKGIVLVAAVVASNYITGRVDMGGFGRKRDATAKNVNGQMVN